MFARQHIYARLSFHINSEYISLDPGIRRDDVIMKFSDEVLCLAQCIDSLWFGNSFHLMLSQEFRRRFDQFRKIL